MRRSRQGQMTLIMILLVALALVFYAIAVNWSRIATTKASVTIASNTGAATLVSMMASYTKYVLQTQLGGRVEYCSGTSMLVSIIVFIVLVIVIVVVAVFSYGVGGASAAGLFGIGAAASTAFFVGLVVAAVLTMAAIVLQATVIQPGLTKQWNKWQQGLSTTEDQYLERALQTALTAIVSDPVTVDDRWDGDMDGRWWSPEANGNLGAGSKKGETISRFAYYYTDRMKSILTLNDNLMVKRLQDILREVSTHLGLYSASTSGGIWANCYSGGTLIPECNTCCVEKTIRPQSCYQSSIPSTWYDDPAGQTAWQAAAAPDVHPGCNTVNDYDSLYENRNSATYNGTLVRVLGLDDGYIHNAGLPDYFRGEDATIDGAFPFFWTLADTQPNTTTISAAALRTDPACHWCDAGALGGACVPATNHLYYPAALTGQLIVAGCSGDNCCVNSFWSDPAAPAAALSGVQMDKVGTIGAFQLVPATACAEGMSGTNVMRNGWKKGADFKQDTFVDSAAEGTYPIKMGTPLPGMPTALAGGCTGIDTDGCYCANMPAVNQSYWNDDMFDMMAVQLGTYKQATDAVMQAGTAAARRALGANTDQWADNLLDQVKYLVEWQDSMTVWSDSIDAWLNPPAANTYADAATWCVPANASSVSADESVYITNGGAAWGSLDSVINCLDYNKTNATRFGSCRAHILTTPSTVFTSPQRYLCNNIVPCNDMPRSALDPTLNPGFDPNMAAKCESVSYTYACTSTVNGACGAGVFNFLGCTVTNCVPGGVPACTGVTCNGATSTCQKTVPAVCTGTENLWKAEYFSGIQDSQTLAVAQAPKFTKRSDYLKAIKAQALAFQTTLDATNNYLSNIPDPDNLGIYLGPAHTAITGVVNQIKNDSGISSAEISLGNKIIYGWVSPRPEKWRRGGRTDGYLHIVKVEATLPKRSADDYNIGINVCTNRFAWVKTESKNWGTKRCYYLRDHTGCVGVRVIRYDEDHDPSQGGVMSFLSGLPLWQILYHNPHTDGSRSEDIASIVEPGCTPGVDGYPNCDIVKNCFQQHYSKRWKNFANPAAGFKYALLQENSPTDMAGGYPRGDTKLTSAFMLNLPLVRPRGQDDSPPQELIKCLEAAEHRLQRGVYSETCAKYYADGSDISISFRPCSTCCN